MMMNRQGIRKERNGEKKGKKKQAPSPSFLIIERSISAVALKKRETNLGVKVSLFLGLATGRGTDFLKGEKIFGNLLRWRGGTVLTLIQNGGTNAIFSKGEVKNNENCEKGASKHLRSLSALFVKKGRRWRQAGGGDGKCSFSAQKVRLVC